MHSSCEVPFATSAKLLRISHLVSVRAIRSWPERDTRPAAISDSNVECPTGSYAFNDAHAVMAFVGAGRRDAAIAVIGAQTEAMARENDNAAFTREVGHAVARAILAFGDGDFARTVSLLRPVRSIAHRFGGSHAQRGVLDLTLIEAAFRAGHANLAAALASERVEARHESPLTQLFARRAAGLAMAA